MTATRVCISALLLIVGLAIAPAAGAALADGAFAFTNDGDGDADGANGSKMGSDVSTFMQASSADASEGVDRGMFEAAYESADEDEVEALLAERTEAFAAKYERLEADFADLQERKDDMNPMAYNAQLTRFTVQLSALESSINETEPRAKAAGVDTGELDEIRRNARSLSGPEVAEIARGLAGIDPPGLQNGPSDDAPPGHEKRQAGRENRQSDRGNDRSDRSTDGSDRRDGQD